jgi:superfamily I DNA/RNA helicase
MGSEAFRRFDWQRPSIKLLTMHSAKGPEFPEVFVAGLQALPMQGESLDDAARLLYVAMTRATHALVLSAHGASPVVERVREGVAAVARGLG